MQTLGTKIDFLGLFIFIRSNHLVMTRRTDENKSIMRREHFTTIPIDAWSGLHLFFLSLNWTDIVTLFIAHDLILDIQTRTGLDLF